MFLASAGGAAAARPGVPAGRRGRGGFDDVGAGGARPRRRPHAAADGRLAARGGSTPEAGGAAGEEPRCRPAAGRPEGARREGLPLRPARDVPGQRGAGAGRRRGSERRAGERGARPGTGTGRLGPRPVLGPAAHVPTRVGQARLLRSAYASTPAPITRPATAPTRPYHHAPKRTARRMPTAVPATRPMAV